MLQNFLFLRIFFVICTLCIYFILYFQLITFPKFLLSCFYFCQLYIWWVDERNYSELTRPWYARVLSFPLNYFLPGHQKRSAQKVIDNLWNNDLIEDSQKETAVCLFEFIFSLIMFFFLACNFDYLSKKVCYFY